VLSAPNTSQSPSRQTIWCILESKNAGLVATVFVDFHKNKCNFLHKMQAWRVQFLTGRRRPRRSSSAGAVATNAVWKSAPMTPVVSVPPAPRFHVSLHRTSADRDFSRHYFPETITGASISPPKLSICGINSHHTGLFYNLGSALD